MSGRWGFRPLGRGDGGKRNPKLLLTSRRHAALASSTTAHRSSVNCHGSRDQLLITSAIVLPTRVSVDSSNVPSQPVLSTSCFRTVPQVPSYRPHTRERQFPQWWFARSYPNFFQTASRTDAFQTVWRDSEGLNSFNHSPLSTAIRYSSIPCMT